MLTATELFAGKPLLEALELLRSPFVSLRGDREQTRFTRAFLCRIKNACSTSHDAVHLCVRGICVGQHDWLSYSEERSSWPSLCSDGRPSWYSLRTTDAGGILGDSMSRQLIEIELGQRHVFSLAEYAWCQVGDEGV